MSLQIYTIKVDFVASDTLIDLGAPHLTFAENTFCNMQQKFGILSKHILPQLWQNLKGTCYFLLTL